MASSWPMRPCLFQIRGNSLLYIATYSNCRTVYIFNTMWYHLSHYIGEFRKGIFNSSLLGHHRRQACELPMIFFTVNSSDCSAGYRIQASPTWVLSPMLYIVKTPSLTAIKHIPLESLSSRLSIAVHSGFAVFMNHHSTTLYRAALLPTLG